jgi:DNA modification methylase
MRPHYETKLGQLFRGDCLGILPELPPESYDLIFADPPFNLDSAARGRRFPSQSGSPYRRR